MAKYKKLTGTHYRKEGSKQVAYNPGSVIEASEEELRKADPTLATWERVADNTPTSGNADGIRTSAQWLFQMERQSKILHPELISLGDMVDYEAELNMRTSNELDRNGFPKGMLVQAEADLQEATRKWNYMNDVKPVNKRSAGPPRSEEITRCQAQVGLIKKEIAYLQNFLKPKLDHSQEKAAQIAKNKKEQAEKFAYHPAFKDNPDAKRIREAAEKKMTRKRASA
jgi:hypothetical protein